MLQCKKKIYKTTTQQRMKFDRDTFLSCCRTFQQILLSNHNQEIFLDCCSHFFFLQCGTLSSSDSVEANLISSCEL